MSEHTCVYSITSQCKTCVKMDVAVGRKLEREAIVAWLREQLSCSEEWESANEWALGCIERGEHLRGDDE